MKPREFTFDLALDDDPPDVDDYMRGPNVVYRVLEVRPVDSRIWGNRWKLRVERVGATNDEVFMATLRARVAGGLKLWPFETSRGQTPSEYFGQPWPPAVGVDP